MAAAMAAAWRHPAAGGAHQRNRAGIETRRHMARMTLSGGSVCSWRQACAAYIASSWRRKPRRQYGVCQAKASTAGIIISMARAKRNVCGLWRSSGVMARKQQSGAGAAWRVMASSRRRRHHVISNVINAVMLSAGQSVGGWRNRIMASSASAWRWAARHKAYGGSVI